jgi:aryl-alcohol dehydrogenase-like predicted oxidoreductase
MGGCPMGGYGWGNTSEQELIGAVHKALEMGITMFDTADTYGLGQSEKTLGKALGGRRSDVIIASKFGVRIKNGKTFYDNSRAWICEACDDSLKRLGTDYIDIYQVHYRDGVTPLDEVVDTLERLKVDGKIRYYGLSNIHKEDAEEIKPYIGRFVTFQDEYSLACRKNEDDILEMAKQLDMNPLTWGSLGQGVLTGKYTRDNVNFGSDDRRSRDIYVNFHGEKLEKNLRIVDVMKNIAEKYHKSVPAVAIRFILDYIPDSIVLCGAKRPSQVEGNAEGMDWILKKEDIQMLNDISKVNNARVSVGVVDLNRKLSIMQLENLKEAA